MRADKAGWFRPVYGYAAAAVCVALAAWGAANPPPTLGLTQTLERTDRDTQLPLERFAIQTGSETVALPVVRESESPATQTPQRHPARHLPALAGQSFRPDARIGTYLRQSAGAGSSRSGFSRPASARRDDGTRGYYRTIQDWKNWT